MVGNTIKEEILLGSVCYDLVLQHKLVATCLCNSEMRKKIKGHDIPEYVKEKALAHADELKQIDLAKDKEEINTLKGKLSTEGFDKDAMAELFKKYDISYEEYNEVIFQVLYDVIKNRLSNEWDFFPQLSFEGCPSISSFKFDNICIEELCASLKASVGDDLIQISRFAKVAVSYMKVVKTSKTYDDAQELYIKFNKYILEKPDILQIRL